MTVRPSLAEGTEECDEMEALHGVGAVQRLVEHEHLRVGDERGGDLRALPHALAEAARPAVRDVGEPDRLDGPIGRTRVGDAVQVGDVANELPSGEDRRHGFVLGHEGERSLRPRGRRADRHRARGSHLCSGRQARSWRA